MLNFFWRASGKRPPRVIEHPELSQHLLSTSEEVAALVEVIAPFPRIGVDTEADSMHCYHEKLCLIQISVPGCDALVDPLAAGIDLRPLWRTLEKREIILQGADYDLRLLRRNGFAEARSVFDTMLAARLLGLEQFSLAALLLKYFQVELAKGSQKANWARRPLTDTMSAYARKDTEYLIELAALLEGELEAKGRLGWHREWCARAVEQAAEVRGKDPDLTWRITGSHKLSPRAGSILRAIWRWRDEEASRADRPSFHILGNEPMLRSATRIEAGERIEFPKMNSGRFRRFQKAVDDALSLPESEWPQKKKGGGRPRATPEQEASIRAIRGKRDAMAKKLGIDPSVIAPRAVLEGLADDREETMAGLMDWQRDLLLAAGA